MNLENTIYATNIAIDTLIDKINSKECVEKELHYYIGTALFWTASTLDKMKNSKIEFDEEEKIKINAFKGANNALKHLENLVSLNSTDYGFRFDEDRWPLKFEQHVYWSDMSNINNIKRNEQKEAYKSVLEGKLVGNTFRHIQELINKKINELKT